jgi:hypothetical protein
MLLCDSNNNLIVKDSIYLVTICPNTEHVRMICIGIGCVDNTLQGSYSSLSELPTGVQGRIATLMITEQWGVPIDEVGVRISEDTFWIYN